jgi:hypothetical protein
MKAFVTIAALALILALQGKSPVKPKPDPKKSPADLEKERIEREVQGVWEIFEYNDPTKPNLVRGGGYMILHDGWMSLNIVVTSRHPSLDRFFNDYTGSIRRYEITGNHRLRLTNVWGFFNKGVDIAPDLAGSVDERQIVITGPPQPGQRLRMARTPDDSITFIRRSAAPPLPAEPQGK